MSRVNKFDAYWQLVRVDAREYKDVRQKVLFVTSFLRSHPSYENAQRVLNWAKMSRVAYRDKDKQQYFDVLIDYIDNGDFNESVLELASPVVYSDRDLLRVYNDLKKRKNDFQHGGVMPKDQAQFMVELEDEIKTRELD
jgi:hypothetical protein